MNSFTFDEIKIGEKASFTHVITDDMMKKFFEISGDNNPLHVNLEYAREKKFPSCVAYGMLTSSLYSTLAGVYLPGERCLLRKVHSDFHNPAFVGDIMCIEGTVVEKHESTRTLKIKAVIRNQDGKRISKALIEAGVFD